MEFKLWVVQESDDDQPIVYHELNDSLTEIFGESLKEHTFVLKSPITNALATEADRLMWKSNPIGGLVKVDALRQSATISAFLASWTLPQALTLDGCEKLAPTLNTAIFQRVEGIVYPNPLASQHYKNWLAKQDSSAEQPS